MRKREPAGSRFCLRISKNGGEVAVSCRAGFMPAGRAEPASNSIADPWERTCPRVLSCRRHPAGGPSPYLAERLARRPKPGAPKKLANEFAPTVSGTMLAPSLARPARAARTCRRSAVDKMLYVAMTGASQNTLALQSHANNLANISTSGFRRDFEQARSMPVFGDSLPARAYAMSERPGTDFTPG